MRSRVVAFVAAVVTAGIAVAASTSSGPPPPLTYRDHVVGAGHTESPTTP